MTTTMIRGLNSPKKHTPKRVRIEDLLKIPDITINLSRSEPFTREEFVIHALRIVGEEGLFVNALLRGWNEYRTALGKSPSSYSSFRKVIWNMKQKGIIESVPENEITDKDLKGTAPWKRSFYRLTLKYENFLS